MRLETPSEHQEQSAFIEYCRTKAKTDPRYGFIIGVPNGFFSNAGWKAKMIREGLTKGVPDVLCLYPVGEHHGLAIEFKKEGGRISREQRDWLNKLHQKKWSVNIAYSAGHAITIITKYFALDPYFT